MVIIILDFLKCFEMWYRVFLYCVGFFELVLNLIVMFSLRGKVVFWFLICFYVFSKFGKFMFYFENL